MKPTKIKHYRLSVSRTFPTTHRRKGEPTYFVEKIKASTICRKICYGECEMCEKDRWLYSQKLHTCRGKYDKWAKIMAEVQAGKAVIDVYYWDGKPYGKGVKQVVFATLDKDSGCGVQRVVFIDGDITRPLVGWDIEPETTDMAKNDGLPFDDFKAWFEGYDLSLPMAIIHFTKFRYY